MIYCFDGVFFYLLVVPISSGNLYINGLYVRLFQIHDNESVYKGERDLADLFSLYFSLYLRCGLWCKKHKFACNTPTQIRSPILYS